MLNVRRATHRYGDKTVLDNVSISASSGEFLTMLGESGSGKTTLLRIVAGLAKPTHVDALEIGGQDVSGVAAAERNCSTVFQHYALFPHMSVGENIEYGLRTRGVPRGDRRRSALAALDLIRLSGFYDRRIHQLSGGERQRVALARALVTRPDVLLLDEPLGALDEKLRQEMQSELAEIHRKLGLTFVYVTHSQEEAVTMSDRIALFRKGRIAQLGTPRDLFDRPCSSFVAQFMGVENVVDGIVEDRHGEQVRLSVGGRMVTGIWRGVASPSKGQAAAFAVRAESVRPQHDIISRSADGNRFECRLRTQTYKGKHVELTFGSDAGLLRGRAEVDYVASDGPQTMGWSVDSCSIVPIDRQDQGADRST